MKEMLIKAYYSLLLIGLLTGECAWSKEVTDNKTLNPQNQNSETLPQVIILDTSPLEKTIRESIQDASKKSVSKEKLASEEKLVFYNLLLVIGTFLLAGLAFWQGFLFRRSVISEQRPWVVVDKIIPASDLNLNSGLSFTFIIKNVGKSPAMNVDVSAIFHLPHRGDVHQAHKNIRIDQTNTRKKLIAVEAVSFGHLLIPGSDLNITVRAANEPIEYHKAAAVNPTGEIIIFIIGQVSYKFGTTNTWHESSFIFSVSKKGGQWVTLADNITAASNVEIKAFSAGFYAT